MNWNHHRSPLWLAGRSLSAARWPIVLAAVVLLGAPGGAQTIQESTHSFRLEGEKIAMQCVAPAKVGKHPAVLLLHGSEGMKDAPIYRHIAHVLAKHGYVALIVHYFDRTATKRIEAKDINEKLFKAWRETVRQAVFQAAKLPGVDDKHIGLLGFSLGGVLSLAVAMQTDLPIAAVADFFGGLPEKLREKAKSLPPTLIVHGDADKTVPVKEALDLQKLLRQHKRTYDETRIYAGQDHLFKRNLLDPDVTDAQDRTLAFFAKHLKPPPVVRGP